MLCKFVLVFIVFSALFSFSQQASPLQSTSGYDLVSWGSRRSVAEDVTDFSNSSLILAKERTYRKDPSDGFKYYKRGWNISESHYIYSVAFTAAPLFLIATLWFVGFGLCLLLICLCFCCCQRRSYGYSRTAYALSLILLSFFTVAAIAGSVVLYTGQGKFHSSTTDTVNFVVNKSDTTVDNLRNVSDYLAAAKRIKVNQFVLPPSIQNSIDSVETKINSSAVTLEHETKKNSKDIQNVLDVVGLALVIISAVMLLVAFLGFLFSIFGMQYLVYILVVLGWVLVTLTFILCGIFIALHNATGDTCVAMDQWVQNPTAHTALDDILPCVEPATAQEILSESKDVTFQLVIVVNQIIVNLSNIDIPPGLPFSYNQSGPLVPVLCSPFNPDKTDRKCIAGEVQLSDAAQVWKNYICQVSGGNCTTVGRLTPTMYEQMVAATNVSYGLNQYGPFLADLLDCSFVREAFTGIHDEYCPDLRLYSRWVYIGLELASGSVMLSLIFWVLYARERRHRKYTKLIKNASAPNSFEEKGRP
ncbi:Plasma membrane fusion PRM1 [Heracleum sosnowskyi]|uniref:Plasma membrane fusion PRM1 n=1 Tax=Heracleum sosnowskyi TaxID=360622 RepID=A0AAD8M6I4_9APIA|nr:Plasma membrane fusion PRM1 [Heracleum sosnowskyi]